MGSIISSIVVFVGWCICTAAGSLCKSCFGNDKPSTTAPGATSGRRRSVLLLVLAVILSLAFQYGIAPALQKEGNAYIRMTPPGKYLVRCWTAGCDDLETVASQERCSGNNGVYRVASCTTLFYVLAAMAASCKPTANREAWPAKYALFLALVVVTVFLSNSPIFDQVYRIIAMIGGAFFVLFQQVILIDVAYNWNDSWVEKSNVAEQEEVGSGKKWLTAILVSCCILFLASIAAIIVFYVYFSGCTTNNVFISVTLIMGIAITGAQLSGEEGSLLSSAVMFTYATFLCYNAISKNPDATCNPRLGEQDVLAVVLGIGLTILSLAWTGWSSTAEKRVNGK
mmetsp:Transcript_32370/g.49513  ORF Transcript_32370/g.49513 Transcript_32370/m.49513 type:complete len:340 (+) Transcript_32370:42-1061(+)